MPKPQRIPYLVPTLLFCAVAIVGLNAWLALSALATLETNQFWVEHTWQVISQVERIMSTAKDAETGVRGYLITRNVSYLSPYTTAVEDLPGELSEFQHLTADNPSQRTRITLMRAVLDERFAILDQSVELRRTGQMDSLNALIMSGEGISHMDHLRRIADEMEAEERRLLGLRTAAKQASARRARLTLLFASALDILLIGLLFRYLAHERSLRLETEQTAESLATSREEIVRKVEEIQMLNVTLEERVRQRTVELETTNRELEAFSYSVSHDLRAPLRTIDGFSLALEEDYSTAVDAAGRDYIKRVRAGVQRMGQLIDALLQLSRITRAEVTREDVDLTALGDSVVENLREENAGRDLDVTVDRGMRVHADPKLIRVALENLLNNAAKFTSKKPQAIIHFGWDSARQAWFVRDNGAGFDMYYVDKLFNAFNRLHGEKDFKGSGIGLATVARVVRRHHGRIWAESAVEHGATFWFTVG